jgi:DNA (cytosine-5)-methyltransferase 1
MLSPQFLLPIHGELAVDLFAGGGGASTGIGLRMLTPRELYRAQGFPDDYQIERGADGRRLTKTEQVRMCGNSVCPPVAQALVAVNYREIRVGHPMEAAA